ncbi:MAG: SDR family NAD(P)-dependent oxidoreductase [Burkholderiaceae bacterium]
MTDARKNQLALIVGVGNGLSASLARLLSTQGYQLVLAARNTEKIASLAQETGASVFTCDASQPDQVAQLFSEVKKIDAHLRVSVYNPSARVRGAVAELDPEEVRVALQITAFGAFLVGKESAAMMLDQPTELGQRGTILFTGASAGVKGFPRSAAFAMGKFAQRGLSESMARELHPQGIHVAWVNIDGGIRNQDRPEAAGSPDSLLDPDAIAQTYLDIIRQNRSAWSSEIAVRPWVEPF